MHQPRDLVTADLHPVATGGLPQFADAVSAVVVIPHEATLGVLPAAVLYAAAGTLGWSGEIGLIAFGLVLLVAALTWFVGRVRPGAKGRIPRLTGTR